MRSIILAAGQGTRLMPLTKDKPKCMVKYNKKPIISYIIEAMKENGISDISIVTGYKKEVLEEYLKEEKITFFSNDIFDKTNMVYSLFKAKSYMTEDVIISYSDIIYNSDVLKKIINSNSDFSVVIDKEWEKLWSLRMDNILSDAETLKIESGKIKEIGKKTDNLDDIQAQYIGLIKISAKAIPKVLKFYESLETNILYDGQSVYNMYMTTFIQLIIDNLMEVNPIEIYGHWLEIDTIEDLNNYEEKEYNVT
ncbi:phosphocholine cytidylyltransferase family protein [Halarcobacter sp.]|uniref:phosphocholine cytidylyltransferase family protein n=1 Tax=Halarcobacter sp. TaxID=2321133 RepID=UPI0029F59D54|nr:phosphocholine cytidylyltransferase family protein [Halarcobacter sp.]